MKYKQRGFTLIELVSVIVILGIIAAVAVPRFLNITSNARAAVLEGLYGSVQAASELAHAQALAVVPVQTGATGSVSMEGTTVTLIYGYPDGTLTGIQAAFQLTPNTFTVATTGGVTTWTYTGVVTPANCQVSYTPATGTIALGITAAPAISISTTINCS
jgi:MSHA pilin protein MshA